MRSRAQWVLLAACGLLLITVVASFLIGRVQPPQPPPLAPLAAETRRTAPRPARVDEGAGAASDDLPGDGAQPSQTRADASNDLGASKASDGARWSEEKVQELERRLDEYVRLQDAVYALEGEMPALPERPLLGEEATREAQYAAMKQWHAAVLQPWQDRSAAASAESARSFADLRRLYPEAITLTDMTIEFDYAKMRALAGRRLVIPARDSRVMPTRTPYNGPGS